MVSNSLGVSIWPKLVSFLSLSTATSYSLCILMTSEGNFNVLLNMKYPLGYLFV